ncbi:MAG: Holliday junction DNA helicase RuvA [Patiriisocius sp.]|jgi:Holliday junction DNA helicase RuvA
MIRHIRGTIADITEGQIVVDVSGVGYLINVHQTPEHFTLEADVKLFTHMAVRETAQDLYGFPTRDELELFTILLTLPKIGPKSALQIMQKADLELLRSSVLSGDAAHLSKMSGLGKKTAEKVVLGLKDAFAHFAGAYTNAADVDGTIVEPPFAVDAIDALIALGYPQADARKAIHQLPPEINTATQAVHAALKELGKA